MVSSLLRFLLGIAGVAELPLEKWDAGRGYAVVAGFSWALTTALLGMALQPAGRFALDYLALLSSLVASVLWTHSYLAFRFSQWRPRGHLTREFCDPLAAGLTFLASPLPLPEALLMVMCATVCVSFRRVSPAALGGSLLALALLRWPFLALGLMLAAAAGVLFWCHRLRHVDPVLELQTTTCSIVFRGRESLIKVCGPENFLPFESQVRSDMQQISSRHGGSAKGGRYHFPSVESGQKASRDFKRYLANADRQLRQKGLPELAPELELRLA